MKHARNIAITFLIIICCTISAGGEMHTRLFDSRDIIASEYNSICSDKDGYIWIGTNSGLFRFDGLNFDKYTYEESDETSLSNNRVLKIYRDSKHRMWIATASGLNLLNPETDSFTRINLPDVDFYGYIMDVLERRNGDVVFEVSGVGLYVIPAGEKNLKASRFPNSRKTPNNITALTETTSGALTGATHIGEIIVIDGRQKNKNTKLTDSSIRNFISNGRGKIFVTNSDSAWLWDPSSNTAEKLEINGDNVLFTESSACLTKEGDILVGTMKNGVMKLRENSKRIEEDDELHNSQVDTRITSISSVHESSDGKIWTGCSNKGIIMATESAIPLKYINIESTFPTHYGGKSHIATLPGSKTVWTGYRNGRLSEITKDGRIIHETQLPGNIGCMMASSKGTLYLGIDNKGLSEYNPVTDKYTLLHEINGYYDATCITEDNDGNVYLGVSGTGVKRINPNTGIGYWIKDEGHGFDPIWPSSLYCDSNNNIWLGLYSALWIYNPSNEIITSISGKHREMVKAVHNGFAEGKDGRIWDASSNGVFIIEPTKNEIVHLTPKNGLTDLYTGSIVIDKEGFAWIGTNREILRIDSNLNIIKYLGNNPTSDSDFNSAVMTEDGKNAVFSGIKGITILNTDELDNSDRPEAPIISGIYSDNRKVNVNTKNVKGHRMIKMNGNRIETLYLSPDDNAVEIRIAMPDYSHYDNITHEWRIKGISDNWRVSNSRPGILVLPHLPSGNYTLEIRTRENSIVSDTTTLKVNVSWPWYLSPWARTVYALILIGLLYFAYRAFLSKQKNKVAEERIKFFMNISHEIRSPLTLIMSPLERMIRRNDNPAAEKDLKMMHRNASRILALTNQLLDMRKIEKGKMQIECQNINLIPFVKELVDIFMPQAEERNLKLEFKPLHPEDTVVPVSIDTDNFDKVLVNLLTNALKYTDKGEITVEAGKITDENGEEKARIIVKDTGSGIDPKMRDHLFDRFYQDKEQSRKHLGFGIGLDLCQMLVQLHGGTITGDSREDGEGSVFTVTIPLVARQDSVQTQRVTTEQRAKKALSATTFASDTGERRKINARKSKLNILVADDDKEMRDYIKEVFQNDGTVFTASTGREAVNLLHDHSFDLVVTDVVMPDMDGIELLSTIRKYSVTYHIPVIMLSSQNEVADRLKGWDTGADAYLGKPFNTDELLAIADNLLENRQRLKGKYSGAVEMNGKVETPELKGNDEGFMNKIAEEINKNLSDPELNVEKLCESVGMSRTHLNRKMKEIFGYSPSEFIRNVRMKKACELLENPDVDISQIAYSVGFSSQAHFSTTFKKMSGVTPTEYRMKHSKPQK